MGEGFGVVGYTHALAAATRCGFDDDRKADLFSGLQRVGRVLYRPVRPRNDRHSHVLRQFARRGFVAHEPYLLGGRADERDLRLGTCLGELRALGQEAVPRMYGVGAGDFRGGDDSGNVEIGQSARTRAYAHIVIRKADVQRFLVRLAVHRDRCHAKLAARSYHPQRNFPAVGD